MYVIGLGCIAAICGSYDRAGIDLLSFPLLTTISYSFYFVDDFDIVDACGIFAWYMNKQVEIATMCTPWYDDCKSDNP